MSVLDILFKIRSLRALSREYTLEQLQEALDKLNQVVHERVQQEEQYRAENKGRVLDLI